MIEIELVSGRKDVILTHPTIAHMTPLYNAQHYTLAHTFIRAIQQIVNVDLTSMYLEDFRYLLAMIDKICWTQGHRIYEWRCTSSYYVTYDNQRHYTPPSDRRYDVVECNALNSEEIFNTKVITNKWKTLPEGMVHPTVGRWAEAHDLLEELGPVVFDAMWIDSDLSLKQTVELATYKDLMEVKSNKYEVCECVSQFKCAICLRQYTNKQPLDLLNFLRVYSETSIMNMTHDLAVHRKTLVPDTMTIKNLLYWHGMLIKDLQKAAEEAAKRASLRRGRT